MGVYGETWETLSIHILVSYTHLSLGNIASNDTFFFTITYCLPSFFPTLYFLYKDRSIDAILCMHNKLLKFVLFLCFPGYQYSKSMKFARNVKLPANAAGCDCKGLCWDPKTCACARLNGSDFPYVHRDGGR